MAVTLLRAKGSRENGKEHRTFSIVENRRVSGRRVVQRHVPYLGEINDSQAPRWRKSIKAFDDGAARPRTPALIPEHRCEGLLDDRANWWSQAYTTLSLSSVHERVVSSESRQPRGVMADIGVCIVRVPKASYHNQGGYSAGDLGQLVDQAGSYLDRLVRKAQGPRMVVAPEYFFSPVGPIGRLQNPGSQPMTRTEKHDLYGDLKGISRRAGGTIIVAGSIFYRKGTGAGARGLNVCPVLQNGKIIYKYYKKFDDGVLGKNDPAATYDHKNTEPYFKAGGIRFGIEVCGDHTNNGNNLASWLATNPKTIDVQLLISDGNAPFAPNMAARVGGYFIHCDLNGEADAAVRVYTTGATWQQASRTIVEPRIVVDTGLPDVELNCFLLTNV